MLDCISKKPGTEGLLLVLRDLDCGRISNVAIAALSSCYKISFVKFTHNLVVLPYWSASSAFGWSICHLQFVEMLCSISSESSLGRRARYRGLTVWVLGNGMLQLLSSFQQQTTCSFITWILMVGAWEGQYNCESNPHTYYIPDYMYLLDLYHFKRCHADF
jgi:hypothetical protein